jgi:hypothetical protein
MNHFRLAEGMIHSGGVLAAKLEKSCLPQEKFMEKDRPYNRGHGKRTEGKQDGGVARRSEEVW